MNTIINTKLDNIYKELKNNKFISIIDKMENGYSILR